MARKVILIVFWLCLLWEKYWLFHEAQFNCIGLFWEELGVENWKKQPNNNKTVLFLETFSEKHVLILVVSS